MSKYQETTGYWVYGHITPNGMIYIGMSKMQPCRRWNKSMYKESSLEPYIAEYGWDNIKHVIFRDRLTKEQSQILEDLLILQAIKDNWCINERRSGCIYKHNKTGYKQTYNHNWHNDHKEERKEYYKQRYSTNEGKIYNRVKAYNQHHPNKAIETPMEAKQKYLQWGYIPTYIKNDDLI